MNIPMRGVDQKVIEAGKCFIPSRDQQVTSRNLPDGYLEWIRNQEIPFRLKHINPTTLPRRWQTPNR